MSKRVILAMSGGVDSSVAALKLIEQGYDVVGVFMASGTEHAAEGTRRSCCSADDAADAARVAGQLGIPFYSLNYRAEFDALIDFFCQEYLRGRTPNPCVLCNSDLKFGHLVRYADGLDADYVATGHYARVADGRLMRGVDRTKDQSYVLFGIQRAVLSRILFPLGGMTKTEVRAAARAAGLKTMDKEESQDICFVPGGDYRQVLAARGYEGLGEGSVEDARGRILGAHAGTERYTIGQRRGLGIAAGKPLYVTGIEPETGTVLVGDKDELLKDQLTARNLNFLADVDRDFACTAKIRYAHEPAPCRVRLDGDGAGVRFEEPVSAVAPGQAVVFYEGETVLGGGWIETEREAR